MNKKIIAASIISLLIGAGLGYFAADFTYRSQINELESKISTQEVLNQINENIIERTTNIVAINGDDEGVLATLTVNLSPGNGGVFCKSRPLMGFDFQGAQINAVEAAANFTDFPLVENDDGFLNMHTHYIVSSKTDEEIFISRIDGPSAGAAAALITVAALKDEKIRNDVIITGTISSDGSIGNVGGVMEKAKAAEDAGMNIFLVPEGQSVKAQGEWRPISYLKSYASEQGWDLEIKEVSNIEEATEYFFE